MNELIKLLNNIQPGKGEFNYGDTKIVYDIQPDGYSIRFVKNQKGSDYDIDKVAKEHAEKVKQKKEVEFLVNGFTKTMDQIDGDLFVEACDIYNKIAPISLNEFGKAVEEKNNLELLKVEIKRFCEIILNVSREKVNYFNNFIKLVKDYMN